MGHYVITSYCLDIVTRDFAKIMRRIWLLTLMLLVPVLLLGFAIGSNLRLKPAPQAESLLTHYRTVRGGRISIVQTIKSRYPAQFEASMSRSSYSEGWYYGADHWMALVSTPTTSGTGSADRSPQDSSMRALPFPPIEAWCVTLHDANQTTMTVILAEHQDLYNAEWVVHELPNDPQQAQTIPSQIGCN